MKVNYLITLLIISSLSLSMHAMDTKDENAWTHDREFVALVNNKISITRYLHELENKKSNNAFDDTLQLELIYINRVSDPKAIVNYDNPVDWLDPSISLWHNINDCLEHMQTGKGRLTLTDSHGNSYIGTIDSYNQLRAAILNCIHTAAREALHLVKEGYVTILYK